MRYLLNDPVLKERRRELRRNQTDAERVFWSQVRNGQCNGLKFFRQYSVGSYIIDFYCPARKLAIELDGGHHNLPDNWEYDVVRSEFLNSCGITVLRFWNHDVLCELSSVMARIEAAITPPGLPLA